MESCKDSELWLSSNLTKHTFELTFFLVALFLCAFTANTEGDNRNTDILILLHECLLELLFHTTADNVLLMD